MSEEAFSAVLLVVGSVAQVAGVLVVVWDICKASRRLKDFEGQPPFLRPVGKSLAVSDLFPTKAEPATDQSDRLEQAVRVIGDRLASSIDTLRDEFGQDLSNVDAFRRHDTDALRSLVLDLARGGGRRIAGALLIIFGLILATVGSVCSLVEV
jgi:hypothetical protein